MGLREEKKQQTRQLLLSIAERLFNDSDFESVTVDDIVSAANISRKTFFNYFQSKNMLLEEWALDWFARTNVWSSETDIFIDSKSALVPPDVDELLEWISVHRRILKMVLKHTNLFLGVRLSGSGEGGGSIKLITRGPRLKRVVAAQQAGLVRNDISAENVCDMYDALRYDVVSQWLMKGDRQAMKEDLKIHFDIVMKVFLKGISPE